MNSPAGIRASFMVIELVISLVPGGGGGITPPPEPPESLFAGTFASIRINAAHAPDVRIIAAGIDQQHLHIGEALLQFAVDMAERNHRAGFIGEWPGIRGTEIGIRLADELKAMAGKGDQDRIAAAGLS